MNDSGSRAGLPIGYLLLVFVLAVPFWLLGGRRAPLPVDLPLSALVAFVPVIAASILAYRQRKLRGVKGLLQKAVDCRRISVPTWYLLPLLLPPLIYLLSYVVVRWTGLPLPDAVRVPWLAAPAFSVLYFATGAGEELGWTACAVEPVQRRWGALRAGLILGIVWAVWHGVTFVQTGRLVNWIAWQSVKTVGMRMLLVWIYNRSGKSVLATVLYHAADNVSWSLFPNYGTHYNPMVTGALTWLVAAVAIFGWGVRTQPRDRRAA